MIRPTIRKSTLVAALVAAVACSGGGGDAGRRDPLARLTERMGGAERLARLRSLGFDATLVLDFRDTETVAHVEQEIVFPDAVRTETEVEGETTVVATDGARAWKRTAEGVVEADADEARGMVDDARRLLAYALSQAGEPGFRASPAGTSEVEGEACDEIQLTASGVSSTVCVAADGRPLRQSYDDDIAQLGGRGHIDVVFSDHRNVDGILFPYRETMLFDGRPFARATYRYVRADPTLHPARFRPD